MSHYCLIDVQFKDTACLCTALNKLGFGPEQIELCETPQQLRDFQGKLRPETANVIIRRKHLKGPHNDIGFVTGEKAKAIICEFSAESGYGEPWQNRLKQEYAVAATTKHYAKSGKKVSRVDDKATGKVHLYVNA